jgi:Leucine-rich repeat (LRR) protein
MSIKSRLKVQNKKVPMASKDEFLAGINYLDLSECNLSIVPEFIKDMGNLKFLDLSDNFVHGVIGSDLFPSSLVTLNLSNNELKGFELKDDTLGATRSLKYLYLVQNKIRAMPKGLDLAISLIELNLSENKIDSLGDLVTPPALLTLDVSSNDLVDIANTKNDFGSCVTLNFSKNKIREVPSGLFKSRSLRYLDLADNDIEDFSFINRSIGKSLSVNV